MSKLFVDEIVHQSSQGSGTITLGASGETVSFASGVTGLNYPAFEARLSSDQSLTSNVTAKITFDTEIFDTDNCYDNSTNYRFTPTVAGKYFIYSAAIVYGTGDLESGKILYYKNGTGIRQSWMDPVNTSNAINQASVVLNAVVDMNGSSDYIEIFTNVQSGVGQILNSGTQGTYFGAYRIGT